MNIDEVRSGYDTVAELYQLKLADELNAKPFDRRWLADFAILTRDCGRIVEIGCGPGHISNHLAGFGACIEGLDLSPQMIAIAKKAYPHLRFDTGNMLSLPYADHQLGAIVAYYSIVNLTPEDCSLAFSEFCRVLAPGGFLTLAFHLGAGVERVTDWWETDASIDFYLHNLDDITTRLHKAGLSVTRSESRETYGEAVEAPTKRAYLVAQSPQYRYNS